MSCTCAEHVCSLSLAWSLKEQPRQDLYIYRFSNRREGDDMEEYRPLADWQEGAIELPCAPKPELHRLEGDALDEARRFVTLQPVVDKFEGSISCFPTRRTASQQSVTVTD